MKKLVLPLLFFAVSAFGQSVTDTIPSAEPAKIYRTAETDSKPELADGMYTLSLHISKNLKLPEVHNKKLMLFIGFVVETDGTLSDIKFIHLSADNLYKTVGEPEIDQTDLTATPDFEELKKQAVQIISEFDKKWVPATKDGIPVRCQYNYPIIINIE